MKNPLTSLTKRAYRLGPNRAVIARRKGHRLLLSTANWIDNRILAGAEYEDAQLAFARALIGERAIDTVVDIGANFGLYTVVLGALPGVREVHAFEPVRRNFAQLLGNVFVNELSGRVTAHNLALGATPGTATIHINPRSTGVSRLDLGGTRRPDEFSQSETIRIDTLDRCCPLKGRRIFLKVDVEGQGAAVVAGARDFLAGNDVVVQMEVSPSETAAVAALAELGLQECHRIHDDRYFARPA